MWDDVQKIPYKINGDQWITYEDTESVGIKVSFLLNEIKSIGKFL
jgi:chitinase